MDDALNLAALTPNLIVERIEDCLPFWIDRLGFRRTVEVQHDGRLGFVILQQGAIQVMLQTRASLAGDVAPLSAGPRRTILYCTVHDLAPIRRALEGYPLVMPERTTSYGAREIIVADPAGNAVFFGAH